MRTLFDVTGNIGDIFAAMQIIAKQKHLLETFYQQSAIENTGSECEDWERDAERLGEAWDILNNLLHMENDYKDYLLHGDVE